MTGTDGNKKSYVRWMGAEMNPRCSGGSSSGLRANSTDAPTSGAPTFTDGIALVARGARSPNPSANAFYEFATSPEITAMFAERHFRLPVRRDVPQPTWAKDLALKAMPVDWKVVGRAVDTWQRDWEDALQAPGSSTR